MNATIVNMSGENHMAQADLPNVQNVKVPISTDTLMTKGEKEPTVLGMEEDHTFRKHPGKCR